jgi:anti-sigma-K factor RskA
VSPDNPELVDRLAAEYVLGTLRGAARRRFERWRVDSALVEERCRRWEERLLPLARGLAPVRPPSEVWEGIRARLALASAPTGSSQTRISGRVRPRVRYGRRLLALAASLLVVAGLGALLYRGRGADAITQRATIAVPSGWVAWTVEVHAAPLHRAQLVIRAGALPGRQAGHDYELWALAAGGRPISLGVLPAAGDVAHRPLSAAQRDALAGATQVAVSLEPEGGSRTGQPTGPVVLTAPLAAPS